MTEPNRESDRDPTRAPDRTLDPEPVRTVGREAGRLLEIAGVFTRLGFTAFGGPMAHIALMEDELVVRRKWCDRQHFLDMIAAVNLIPGPNSTELAIHLGYIRGGFAGLVVAGGCFITPAVLIILPIAYLYVRYGSLPGVLPVLHSVAAVVVAIIAVACVRLARGAFTRPAQVVVGVVVAAVLVLDAAGLPLVRDVLSHVSREIFCLVVAILVGLVSGMRRQVGHNLSAFLLPIASIEALPASLSDLLASPWVRMTVFFLKTGATLFGSGYVLASFLRTGLVEQTGWLSPQQLSDTIAVGQFTPGPLLTSATFAGYLLGHSPAFGGGHTNAILGAVLATIAIFAPAFILIAALAPVLDRLRRSTLARSVLDTLSAAVVLLIAVTILEMLPTALLHTTGRSVDFINLLLLAITLGLMIWRNINATWFILLALCVGGIRTAAGV